MITNIWNIVWKYFFFAPIAKRISPIIYAPLPARTYFTPTGSTLSPITKRDENAHLVTGNIKHFPKEPFIVTPNELLDIIT